MRLPNGYGSVTKLSGRRRKPWRVRKTAGWTEDGKQLYQNIGYFRTKSEALAALAAFNKDPYDTAVTLGDVYAAWSEKKLAEVKHPDGITTKWKVLSPLADVQMAGLTFDQVQKVFDESGKGSATLLKTRGLLGQLYEYAEVHRYIPTGLNFSTHLDPGNASIYSIQHSIFTPSEVELLWSASADPWVQTVLMLLYSGLRVSELLNLKKNNVHDRHFDIVASKTEAGVRPVPIAKKTLPFWQAWMQTGGEYLLKKKYSYNGYRFNWDSVMTPLGLAHHIPHDTRHTCVSMLTEARVDERFIQAIVGHTGKNVTEAVYTHISIDELIKEIDKI